MWVGVLLKGYEKRERGGTERRNSQKSMHLTNLALHYWENVNVKTA